MTKKIKIAREPTKRLNGVMLAVGGIHAFEREVAWFKFGIFRFWIGRRSSKFEMAD